MRPTSRSQQRRPSKREANPEKENVDKLLDDVKEAIRREDPDHRFCYDFWRQVLTENPHHKVKSILNKPLPHWVAVFNRWQELVRARKTREQIDLDHFIDILKIPKSYGQPIFEGFAGVTGASSNRAKISILVVFATGVLSSRLMSRSIKFKFLLGLFDVDDSGGLSEQQFALFLASVVRGLGVTFAVPESDLPKAAELKRTASKRYERIGQVADALGMQSHHEEGELAHSTIYDWFCGSLSDKDPLSMPYRLMIEHLCPEDIAGVADEFWGGVVDGFKLDHSKPVQIPETMTTCPRHPDTSRCEFLSRKVVLLAREIFNETRKESHVRISEYDLEQLTIRRGWDVDNGLRRKLVEAFERFSMTLVPGANVSDLQLVDLFRFMSPCAQPRHLLMYQQWCTDYDDYLVKESQFQDIADVRMVFGANSAKPILPESDIARIEEEFKRLDRKGDGFVDVADIAEAWEWSMEMASKTMAAFDRDEGRCVDKQEFLEMMCPEEYRLPNMDGEGRHLLGRLLEDSLEKRRQTLQSDAAQCGLVKVPSDPTDGSPRRRNSAGSGLGAVAVLPEVPGEILANWKSFYATLDQEGKGKIGADDLVASGLVSQEVSQALCKLVDAKDQEGISKLAFLESMCRAHSYRMPVSAILQGG